MFDTGGAQKVRVVTWQRNKNGGIVAKRQLLAGLLFPEKWLNLKQKSPQHNSIFSVLLHFFVLFQISFHFNGQILWNELACHFKCNRDWHLHNRCVCVCAHVHLVTMIWMQTVSLSSWQLAVWPHVDIIHIMAPLNCLKILPQNLF